MSGRKIKLTGIKLKTDKATGRTRVEAAPVYRSVSAAIAAKKRPKQRYRRGA